MASAKSVLNQKSLVIVFAYAPAGLGHLRVTDALYHGLPEGTSPILLGSQDTSIRLIHRLLSIHPIIRTVMEWTQRGIAEYISTYLYRNYLRSTASLLRRQLITVLDQQLTVPQTMLVVATHFGLAHQLSVIKNRLEQEKMIKVVLVVQVTDDSPQYIWYVPEADIIFVPSDKTAEKLHEYAKSFSRANAKFEVAAYPISPVLSDRFSEQEISERFSQLQSLGRSLIHVAIPLSGAAVGTGFFTHLIDELHRKEARFVFHVVAKSAPYTGSFLSEMMQRPYVELKMSSHDRGIVDLYEQIYKERVISLEVTKPSEQAFKTLATPHQRGGSILLFSHPVGRQEYDNLDFLRRHNLVPLLHEKDFLFKHAIKNLPIETIDGKKNLENAYHWRGLELPDDPIQAAQFITWCLQEGVLARMGNYKLSPEFRKHSHELNTTGVKEFWIRVANFLKSPQSG